MRFIKFIFTVFTAVTSFAGAVFLFQRYQDLVSKDRLDDIADQFEETDPVGSVTPSTSKLADSLNLSGVYYKAMDPEEITES